MADQVELLFKFNTEGAPQLDTVEAIVKKLGQSSALTGGQINFVEKALESLVASGKTAQQALELVSKSKKSLGAEAANAAKELLKEAAALEKFAAAAEVAATASNSAAAGVRSIGTEAEKTVPSVLAASAALRGLEGGLNIRAAERFLTQFSGINAVLQGTFQIFGALAVADFAVRGVEGLIKLYEAINPVIQAEKEYASVVEESSKAVEHLRAEELKLYIDRVTRTKGTIAGLQARIDTPGDPEQINAARVKEYTEQVAALRARIAAGAATGPSPVKLGSGAIVYAPGRYETTDAKAARAELDSTQMRLQVAIEAVKVDGQRKEAIADELADKVRQKRLDTAKAVRDLEKQIADIQEHSFALQDRATFGAGRFGSIVNAQRAADRAIPRELDAVTAEREANRLGGPNAVHRPDSLYDDKNNAILARQASDTLARAQEFVTAIHEESQKVVRDFQEVTDKAEKAAEALQQKQSADFLKDLGKTIREEEKDIRDLSATLERLDRIDVNRVQRQAATAQKRAELLAGPGQEFGAIESGYRTQLALAQELYEIEQRRVDRISDEGEKDKANADARLAYEDAIDKARSDSELKLLELRKKNLDEYRNTAGKVYDALTASGGGGLGTLVTGQLKILERQIFVNASSGAFQKAGGALGKIGEASGLGPLLAGTVFDPQNSQIDKNTSSLQRATISLDRLTATLGGGGAGITGSLASLPLNLGGINGGGAASLIGLLGSDKNGLTGQGGGVLDKVIGKNVSSKLGDFLSGAALVPGGGLFSGISGTYSRPGYAAQLTAGQRVGNIVGSVGALATAGYGVYSGIQEGGARGATTAISSALGAASLIPGPQQPFVMAAALIAGMVKGLLPDPKQAFDAAQTRTLNANKFTGPTALDQGFDFATGSNAFSDDYRGRTRVIVQNTFHINALDAPSVSQLFQDNGQQIADVVSNRTRSGDPGMQIAINRVVFGPTAG